MARLSVEDHPQGQIRPDNLPPGAERKNPCRAKRSDYGKIRIGGPDALPEFSTFSWYAMLISAGMGIGLMFWSVAEPVFHYLTPSPMFDVPPATAQSAQVALGLTYYHWGIHPWGIYALVGLSLAFFAYNRGLPLTIRSVFHPLMGDRIYGFWGNVIDILSVLATLFGLATSLGLGVKQVTTGRHYLFGLPTTTQFAVFLIAAITFFAVLSIATGLDKGVKMLSMANMVTAAAFMLFLLSVGPTVYILKAFTQNIGFYIQNLPQLSFWVETFYGAEGSNWQNPWTIFYWGWWISWSPFVGMFIARISKGRSVREFILGVMVFPTLLSFLWMSSFGGSALWLQITGPADIAGAVRADVSTALFVMLESFPFTRLTSFIGIMLVTVFFVTSSDSGSLVVDHLTIEIPVGEERKKRDRCRYRYRIQALDPDTDPDPDETAPGATPAWPPSRGDGGRCGPMESGTFSLPLSLS